jgi:hypothetical protein
MAHLYFNLVLLFDIKMGRESVLNYSHRYENLLCEAEREVGRLQIIIDDEEEQERLKKEAEVRAAELERLNDSW